MTHKTNEIRIKTLELGGLALDEQGRPYFRSITFLGVAGEAWAPGLGLTLRKFSVRGLNPVAGGWAAAWLAQDADAPSPPPPPPEKLAFRELQLVGLSLSNDPDLLGAHPSHATLRVEQAELSNLFEGMLQAATIKAASASFSSPRTARRGDRVQGGFQFERLRIEKLRAAFIASRLGLNGSPNAPAVSPIDPGFDTLAWTDIGADVGGARLAVPALNIDVARNSAGVAEHARLAPASLTLSVNPLAGRFGQIGGAIFSTLGYDRIAATLGGEFAYNPASDVARASDVRFVIADGLDLSIDAAVEGVRRGQGKPPGPSVSRLDVQLADCSLTDRLLGLGPLISGASPTALRADTASMIEALGEDAATAGVDPAVASELSRALASFVRAPGKLHVRMAPSPPWSPSADPGFRASKSALGFAAAYMPPADPANGPSSDLTPRCRRPSPAAGRPAEKMSPVSSPRP